MITKELSKERKIVEDHTVRSKLFIDDNYEFSCANIHPYPGAKKDFDLLYIGQKKKRQVAIEETELHGKDKDPQVLEEFCKKYSQIESILTDAGCGGYWVRINRDKWEEILNAEWRGTKSLKDGLLEYISVNPDEKIRLSSGSLPIAIVTLNYGSHDATKTVRERSYNPSEKDLIFEANQKLPPDSQMDGQTRRILIITVRYDHFDLNEFTTIVRNLGLEKVCPNIDEIWIYDNYSFEVAGRRIEEFETKEELCGFSQNASLRFECVYSKNRS